MKKVMRVAGLAAVVAIVAVACTPISAGTPGLDTLRDLPMPTLIRPDSIPCEGVLTHLDCAVITERIQIARAEGIVRRDGDEICVSGRGLASFCLADDVSGAVSERKFYLGSLRSPPIHLFFVEDGARGHMIAVGAREPKQTVVDGIPRPSPDGRFAAVSVLDLDSNGPNRFRIHEVRNDSLPVVFEVEPRGWGPGRPEWIRGDMVRFPMVTPVTRNFRDSLVPDSVTVILSDGEWILVPPSGREMP
jgi:hypothetical protein